MKFSNSLKALFVIICLLLVIGTAEAAGAEGNLLSQMQPKKFIPTSNGLGTLAGTESGITATYAGSTLWVGMNDVTIAGNYAYCAMLYGLLILDIGNPASPLFVSKIYLSGSGSGVAVAGNYAYVADGSSGLQIIDISNPAAPAAAGSYAYLAHDHNLQIIDISNPAAPTLGLVEKPLFLHSGATF